MSTRGLVSAVVVVATLGACAGSAAPAVTTTPPAGSTTTLSDSTTSTLRAGSTSKLPPTLPTTTTTVPVSTTTTLSVTTAAQPADNKPIVDRSGEIVAQGDYSFVDAGQDKVRLIRTALDLTPQLRDLAGTMFGVDVIVGGVAITRAFAFEPAAPLPAGASAGVLQVLAGTNPTTPATYGPLTGARFQAGENLFFLAEGNGRLIVTVGKDEPSLNLGTANFAEAYLI